MLVLGNPAPHSVSSRLPFAYEGQGKVHRFWRSLLRAGLLQGAVPPTGEGDVLGRDAFREALLSASYLGSTTVGLTVAFSLPTEPGKSAWGGVNGVRRLFGSRAMAKLGEVERQRLQAEMRAFFGDSGTVVAFQRDGYELLRQKGDARYDIQSAFSGNLIARVRSLPHIPLVGLPPTRYAHGTRFSALLAKAVALGAPGAEEQ